MCSAFSKRVFGSSRQVAFCKDARRTVMPSADGFYTSWPIPVFKRLYMWLWSECLLGMLKNCTAFQGEMYSAFSKRVFGSSRQVAFCKDARRTVMPSADGFYTSWPIPVFKRLYMWLWSECFLGMLKHCTAFQGEMYSAFSKRVFGSSRQVAFCKDARRTVMPSADGFLHLMTHTCFQAPLHVIVKWMLARHAQELHSFSRRNV